MIKLNNELLFFTILLCSLLILNDDCYCYSRRCSYVEGDSYAEEDRNVTIVLNKEEHDRLIKYFFDKFDGQIMLSEDMRLYNGKWQCQEILLVKEYFSDKNNLGLRLFLKCQSDPEISISEKAEYIMFYLYTTNYYGKHEVNLDISSYDYGLGLDCLLVYMDYNDWYMDHSSTWCDRDKKERGDIYDYCPNLSHLPGTVHTRDGYIF